MSENLEHCELCLNEFNQISKRIFPCLYHCKKMLCIQHLTEHEKSIEKQINLKKQLEFIWKNYSKNFNEDKILKEIQYLKTKLEQYEKLKNDINNLLLINHFHDSLDNLEKFQNAIQLIQKTIEQDNQSKLINRDIGPKIESIMTDEEEGEESHPTIDYESLSSSVTTNNESENMHYLPTDTNPQPEDEYSQQIDESDDHGNSTEMDNEDDDDDDDDNTSLQNETSITPNRRIAASRLRGYCPLTHDGVFGINSSLHGIPLCPTKTSSSSRTYCLHRHFLRTHHLTSFASLALVRAINLSLDPLTTKLFSDCHVILNINELRTINCPIQKPFLHYPLMQIENLPCDSIKQIRNLRYHLKSVHKFTNKAANIIVKSVKADIGIHKIQFPRWIDILQNNN